MLTAHPFNLFIVDNNITYIIRRKDKKKRRRRETLVYNDFEQNCGRCGFRNYLARRARNLFLKCFSIFNIGVHVYFSFSHFDRGIDYGIQFKIRQQNEHSSQTLNLNVAMKIESMQSLRRRTKIQPLEFDLCVCVCVFD